MYLLGPHVVAIHSMYVPTYLRFHFQRYVLILTARIEHVLHVHVCNSSVMPTPIAIHVRLPNMYMTNSVCV